MAGRSEEQEQIREAEIDDRSKRMKRRCSEMAKEIKYGPEARAALEKV